MNIIAGLLKQYRSTFKKMFSFELEAKDILEIDFSVDNAELANFKIIDTAVLSHYINTSMLQAKAKIAVGGYLEDRLIYRKSPHFGSGENARTIHLGVDVWCQAHTQVFVPLDGKIHSFQVNDNFGDYGPTLILEHQIAEACFYTLYGHLTTESLSDKKVGDFIKAGSKLAEIGTENENGNWPPHLHFQVITDMKNYRGDYPGVCSKNEKDKFIKLCPDPKLILKL